MTFLRRKRRASAALEAMLVLPVILVLFGAVSQVMITSQARLQVENAAYAAARSALVHKCPPFDLNALLKSPISKLRSATCTDKPQKWQDAARWALVSASSTTGYANGRGCPDIVAARQILDGSGKIKGYEGAASNAICYAFEPGNVIVEPPVWKTGFLSQLSGQTSVPIEVTVRFKYPLSTPFRRFIYEGKRGDGTYWRWGEATVTLL